MRHDDEGYAHLHWFCAADLAAGENLDAIHPGRRAVTAAKAAGVTSKSDLDRLYKAAMRSLQDDYHAAVGARHGLTRRGPGRRRLTRAQWHEERASAERLAVVLRRGDVALDRNAELTHENTMLAIAGADEGLGRRLAERERDHWSTIAQGLSAELAVERPARQAAQEALATERLRADGLERRLAEARQMLAVATSQAKTLLRALLDPATALLPHGPAWLGGDLWTAIRHRVSASLARMPSPAPRRDDQPSRRTPILER